MRILAIGVYLALSYFITRQGAQHPDMTPFQFLTTEKNLTLRVLYQLPMITVPLNFVTFVSSISSPPVPDPYTSVMGVFTILCLMFYLGGAFLVSKRLPRLFTLYLTFLLSMFSTMFFYIYIDTRLDPVRYFGEDRYYIFSTLFATVLWGLVIKALFAKNKISTGRKYLAIAFMILILFVINNAYLISRQIDQIQYKSEMNKRFITYLKANSDQFGRNSIIVAPYYLSWPASLINRFVLPDTDIILPSDNWQRLNWQNRKNVFVFDYNYGLEPGKDFDPEKGALIDLTQQYRAGGKIVFRN